MIYVSPPLSSLSLTFMKYCKKYYSCKYMSQHWNILRSILFPNRECTILYIYKKNFTLFRGKREE